MSEEKIVEVLINGGQANAGPPLGPALGPLGVNVLSIVKKINELTSSYSGMKVPVKIFVNIENKQFKISVGIPTTAALIIKEAGIEKGSGSPKTEKVGNLSIEQIINIARIKKSKMLAGNLKAAVKEVIGTCVSMGLTIEDKSPKDIYNEIENDAYKILLE